MGDRLIDLALLEVPLAGPMMQLRYPGGLGTAQLPKEQLSEQPVEAVPLATLIERDHESVGATHATQDAGRVRPLGDRVAEWRGELIDDRDVAHELAIGGTEAVQQLGAQVVADLRDVTIEAARQAVGARVVAQQLGGDRDGGRPPLTSIVEHGHRAATERGRSDVRR